MIAHGLLCAVLVTATLVGLASPAQAQPAQQPQQAQPQAATCFASAAGGAAAQTIGLEGTVQASAQCRHALRSDGPWVEIPAALIGRPGSFMDLYAALRGQAEDEDARARVIYRRPQAGARRRGARESEQTLALRFCAHYLMEEELGFRLRAGDQLDVERVTSPSGDCGSAGLELRVIALEGEARGPMVLDREPTQVMRTGQRQLTLPHGS